MKNIYIIITLFLSFGVYSQSPGSVSSNLHLWLKADAGTTGATTVTGWNDQANSFNAVNGTNGPTLSSSAINFNPSIQFDGINSEEIYVS